MSEAYKIHLQTVGSGPTALGHGGRATLVVDRPVPAGGGGLGFNGGQLLYLSIAACLSNDLYREADTLKVKLDGVEIVVDGDFAAPGSASSPISVDVVIHSQATDDAIAGLIAQVERLAEIPRTIREGVPITVRTEHRPE